MRVFNPKLVQKEKIPNIDMVKHEVLENDFKREMRKQNLYRAMILGNTYKKKVRITFEALDGEKQVETTVWAATDKNILLKGGINLPINCIKEIEIAA